MKRLVKKSDIKVEDQVIEDINIIETWVVGDVTSITDSEIDYIISKNSDCMYSGILYRMFAFYGTNKRDVNSLIRVDNKYQSFTKSYDWLNKELQNEDIYNKEDVVIIKVSNVGFDINKFINKYKDIILSNGYHFQEFNYQNEVISKMVNNFEIIYIGDNLK